MQKARGGMGSHKHGKSGHNGPSPAYKQQRTREANDLAAAEQAKQPKPRMFRTLAEALKARKESR